MTSTATPKPQRLPVFDGILPIDIDTARIPSEAIAGATLAALAIPETMGYASMAQMPVITGLYTLVIPVFLFAILGSSRHLVVAADSATRDHDRRGADRAGARRRVDGVGSR